MHTSKGTPDPPATTRGVLDTRVTRHNYEIVHHIPTMTATPTVAAAMPAAAAASVLLLAAPAQEFSFNRLQSHCCTMYHAYHTSS